MRDLYYRLGIKKSAWEQEIRRAISNCNNATIKADASEVLLVQSRRETYDRIHGVLHDIATLRAHLGLNHGDNWRSPESDDFAKEPVHDPSRYDALLKKVGQPNRKSRTSTFVDSTKDFLLGLFRLAAVPVGFAVLFMFIIFISDDIYTTSEPARIENNDSNKRVFVEPELPLPTSGTIRRHNVKDAVAPLEIKTSPGANYLVKLEDTSTGSQVLDLFIRGGSDENIEVPLGTYRLKYAAGQKWYGYEHVFGPDTVYSKANSTFRFYNDGSRVSGYTVTLFQVQDGNLRTTRIPPDQF